MAKPPAKKAREQNLLDGRTWTRYSISIWDDLRKSAAEHALKHPAMFPGELVERLLEIFTRQNGELILDPFCGSGTVPLIALQKNCSALGIDLSADYLELASSRLNEIEGIRKTAPHSFRLGDGANARTARLLQGDARGHLDDVADSSVDLCITSPPYWDILRQRRSADKKDVRNYGDHERDLGNIPGYEDFLEELQDVFARVYRTLKTGAMCVIVVMDLRKKANFYPLHADLIPKLEAVGYTFDDMIIWDRRQEYNNLRPLGYPWVFRVNKVHEFIMFFQKRSD